MNHKLKISEKYLLKTTKFIIQIIVLSSNRGLQLIFPTLPFNSVKKKNIKDRIRKGKMLKLSARLAILVQLNSQSNLGTG